MSELVIPLAVAVGTVLLALTVALVLARRRRGRVRSLLEGEMGLKQANSPSRLGRTEWFEGFSGNRAYVGGLINLSGPDAMGKGRQYRQSVCIVMPVAIESPIGSISHRGMYPKRNQMDRFAALFRFSKSSAPPSGNIKKALMEFAEVHGRINLWTRRRGDLILPTDLFPDPSHLLLWLGPAAPEASAVKSAAHALSRVAEVIMNE